MLGMVGQIGVECVVNHDYSRVLKNSYQVDSLIICVPENHNIKLRELKKFRIWRVPQRYFRNGILR